MFSATYSLAQLFSLIIPGMILFLTTKPYFPLANGLWEALKKPEHAVGAMIPLLFIALAYGIIIQGITFIFSRQTTRWVILRKQGAMSKAGTVVNWGRMITELAGDQMAMIRGVYHFHQALLNLLVVSIFGAVKIGIAPENPAKAWLLGVDVRLWIIGLVVVVLAVAAWRALDAAADIMLSVDRYLADKEEKAAHQDDGN